MCQRAPEHERGLRQIRREIHRVLGREDSEGLCRIEGASHLGSGGAVAPDELPCEGESRRSRAARIDLLQHRDDATDFSAVQPVERILRQVDVGRTEPGVELGRAMQRVTERLPRLTCRAAQMEERIAVLKPGLGVVRVIADQLLQRRQRS